MCREIDIEVFRKNQESDKKELRRCQGSVMEVSRKGQGSLKKVYSNCNRGLEKVLEENFEILRSYNNFSKNVTELLSY